MRLQPFYGRAPVSRVKLQMAVTRQIEGEDLVVRLADWSRWVALNRGFAGRMYAGTWQSKGATGFWMVTNPREAVVIASSSQRSYGWLLDVDGREGRVRQLSPKRWEACEQGDLPLCWLFSLRTKSARAVGCAGDDGGRPPSRVILSLSKDLASHAARFRDVHRASWCDTYHGRGVRDPSTSSG